MKNKCFLSLMLLVAGTAIAGWKDHVPVVINPSAGQPDIHANGGSRRIVRINNTIIALCPNLDELAFRSTNNGDTWTQIESETSTYSGCLITGPDSMVYHFFRYYDNSIRMVKFKYNATPGRSVIIYSYPAQSAVGGSYRGINATVDSNGVLYVATHWGSVDRIYVLRSNNGGTTWADPYTISNDNTQSWYFPHLEVTSRNLLVCTYLRWSSGEIRFAKSTDQGQTWTNVMVSNELVSNPAILTVGPDTFYVFGQSYDPLHRALGYSRSNDQGNTWSAWTGIDNTSGAGYADPSPGLGNDGNIYVAYRSGARSDLAGKDLQGAECRERMARSSNKGAMWDFPDDYFTDALGNLTERTGTRSQIRYQTWWNYGGPLEWIWMQYTNSGANYPIFYDVNTRVQIKSSPGKGQNVVKKYSP